MKTLSTFLLFIFFLAKAKGQQCIPPSNLSYKKQIRYCRIDSNRTRNYTFLQQTLNYSALSYACPPTLDLGSPKKWYILSADIIPEFVIGGRRMPVPIHLTARYKVRILHNNIKDGDTSLPVRTPSFMPGVTLYFPLKYMNDKTKRIYYFSLSGFHHSNGQDGIEFKANGKVNTYNGNFSTNYIEPAFHFRNRKYLPGIPKCEDSLEKYRDIYARIGYEHHIGTAKALRSSYGDHRFNLSLGWLIVNSYCDKIFRKQVDESYYREKYRVVLNTTLIEGARDKGMSAFEKRINVDLNYYWRIPYSPNTSFFVTAGYYGSDTYNIFYQDSYFFARAGIALGFFVAPKLVGFKRE